MSQMEQGDEGMETRVEERSAELEREVQAWELLSHHLGPLMQWMRADVSEIMVNPDGRIWIDAVYGLEDTGCELSAPARRAIIETVAAHMNQVCHASEPRLDGVLPLKGYRFAALVEPATSGPAFTIRLHHSRHIGLREYLKHQVLTPVQLHRLVEAINHRENILLVGGTGSGKTTLANAILERMAKTGHRVMTIEDTPELRCPAPNTIPVYVNRQGSFQYSDALHIALRLRPDRIVVGELRDGLSALSLLKAWNTGHSGGLATLHANSARASLPRLEQLLQEEIPQAPRALIAEAVDLILYIERATHPITREPSRLVSQLAHLDSALDDHGDYQLTYY